MGKGLPYLPLPFFSPGKCHRVSHGPISRPKTPVLLQLQLCEP